MSRLVVWIIDVVVSFMSMMLDKTKFLDGNQLYELAKRSFRSDFSRIIFRTLIPSMAYKWNYGSKQEMGYLIIYLDGQSGLMKNGELTLVTYGLSRQDWCCLFIPFLHLRRREQPACRASFSAADEKGKRKDWKRVWRHLSGWKSESQTRILANFIFMRKK